MASPRAITKDESSGAPTLTRAGLLSVNALWNISGYLIPLAVAVATVPILIHYLGQDRFGLLSLAWVLIGSFSFIDLGLGRTLTQFVASALGRGALDSIAPLVWSALVLMFVFGAFATGIIAVLSPWLVHAALRIPPALQSESLQSLYLLAVGIPIVLVSAGLRGVLEAQQHFGLSNIVRIPLGLMTFAGPLLVLPFTVNLTAVVVVLVGSRLVAAAVYLLLCLKVTPSLRGRSGPRWALMGSMLRMGAWISISNFISPVIVFADRFIIGALISVSVVAYYTVPYDVVVRILVIPGAVAAVLFPALAASFAHDRDRAERLLVRGTKYLFILLLPVTLGLTVFASEGLSSWLGVNFSRHSAKVLQLVAVGVFFNGLANVPFAFVQGAGRADISARLHLIELPFYFGVLLWLIAHLGIDGAAIAFALRSFVDMVILFAISFALLRSRGDRVVRIGFGLAASVAFFSAGAVPQDFVSKAVFLVSVLASFIIISWLYLLSAEERLLATRLFAKALPTIRT